MGALENNFTWSSSRDGTFQRCARQYWWQYYGSWGGWDRSAPSEAREAYVLKNLATRWAWVGTAVHETIESLLRRHQKDASGEELVFERPRTPEVQVEAEVEALTQRMRDQFKESREGHYRARPKKAFGLVEQPRPYRQTDDAQTTGDERREDEELSQCSQHSLLRN